MGLGGGHRSTLSMHGGRPKPSAAASVAKLPPKAPPAPVRPIPLPQILNRQSPDSQRAFLTSIYVATESPGQLALTVFGAKESAASLLARR